MKPILNDPSVAPTPEVLKSTLGSNYENYLELLTIIDKLGLTAQWHYYKDGKSWLCKVLHKKKTVFWLSVWASCFKTTFYFTEKNLEGIDELPINQQIKADFYAHKAIGRLLPMLISITDNSILTDVETVIKYKIK